MNSNHPSSQGFTLIEILLYVALSTLVSLAIVSASWNIIRLGEESFWHQAAVADLSRAADQINTLIRNADSVTLLAPDRLELGLPDTSATAVLSVDSGAVYMTDGTPVRLTGDALVVDSMQFSIVSFEGFAATGISYEIAGKPVFPGGVQNLSLHSGAEARVLFSNPE